MRASLVIALCAFPLAAAAQSNTGGEVWPDASFQLQSPGPFSFVAEGQLKEGIDYDATQWIIGGEIDYQWQRILGRHVRNLDEDKEHHVVLGIGYQYLQTDRPTPQKFENRLIVDATLNFRAGEPLFIGDRNRYEYRWVDGTYSTVYRNRLTLEYDATTRERPVRPYATAEFFYDVTKGEWNEEQYAAGIEWPAGRAAKLQTYYLRQACTTCSPRDLNVIGIGLQFFGRFR